MPSLHQSVGKARKNNKRARNVTKIAETRGAEDSIAGEARSRPG